MNALVFNYQRTNNTAASAARCVIDIELDGQIAKESSSKSESSIARLELVGTQSNGEKHIDFSSSFSIIPHFHSSLCVF